MWIKLTGVVLLVLSATSAGYGLGYLDFQPKIAALRGVQGDQEQELATLKSQGTQRATRLEQALMQLGDLSAAGVTLDGELQRATASLERTENQLREALSNLDDTRSELVPKIDALEEAQGRVTELEGEKSDLEQAQQDLRSAIDVQAEIMGILTQKLAPALGDAALVAQRARDASERGSFENAATLFEDAAIAYAGAQAEAEVTPEKAGELAALVPKEMREPYTLAQKHAEARYRAVSSRVSEFQAATKLYTVVAEWDEQFEPEEEDEQQHDEDEEERTSSPEDIKRWGKIVDEAEEEINAAMLLLDEAAEWAPDLWQEFETQRIELQEWRNLVDGIRSVVLEE
jgi:hypothetical protein